MIFGIARVMYRLKLTPYLIILSSKLSSPPINSDVIFSNCLTKPTFFPVGTLMYKVGLVIQIFDRDPVLRLVPRKSQKPLRELRTPP